MSVSHRGSTMSTRSQLVHFGGFAAAFLLVVLATVSGCGFLFGDQERSWSEDVELDDASVIRIDRYVKFEESNSWSGDAYSATETRATLSFTGNLADLPAWDVPLMPLVLYRDVATGEWVIVATSTRCEVWVARGKPNPPYWEFRLGSDGWREQALSNASLNRQGNLFIRYSTKLDKKHFAPEDKRQLAADARVGDKYRRIQPAINPRYCIV